MLHLYHHPRSTFSRRVRVALLEKQIEHEATVVDLATGEHRKPAFLALNPYGRVPVIDDDGFVLYESAAILRVASGAPAVRALYERLVNIDFSRDLLQVI